MNKKDIIILIIALIVLAGGIWAYSSQSDANKCIQKGYHWNKTQGYCDYDWPIEPEEVQGEAPLSSCSSTKEQDRQKRIKKCLEVESVKDSVISKAISQLSPKEQAEWKVYQCRRDYSPTCGCYLTSCGIGSYHVSRGEGRERLERERRIKCEELSIRTDIRNIIIEEFEETD